MMRSATGVDVHHAAITGRRQTFPLRKIDYFIALVAESCESDEGAFPWFSSQSRLEAVHAGVRFFPA